MGGPKTAVGSRGLGDGERSLGSGVVSTPPAGPTESPTPAHTSHAGQGSWERSVGSTQEPRGPDVGKEEGVVLPVTPGRGLPPRARCRRRRTPRPDDPSPTPVAPRLSRAVKVFATPVGETSHTPPETTRSDYTPETLRTERWTDPRNTGSAGFTTMGPTTRRALGTWSWSSSVGPAETSRPLGGCPFTSTDLGASEWTAAP